MPNITRVGIGFDVHRLIEGRPLILAGVKIEFARGLLGHSDGDVVLHAVAEAIAGATGLPDIGQMFPDNLAATKGIDSRIIVERMRRAAADKGFAVINLDAVVQAEKPKIADYKQQMRESLARILKVDIEAVNLKGRTAEGLGDIGKSEAIACTAIVGMGSTSANSDRQGADSPLARG